MKIFLSLVNLIKAKNKIKFRVLLSLFLIISTSQIYAQTYSLSGEIVDEQSLQCIKNSEISLNDNFLKLNDDCNFLFSNLPAGNYILRIKTENYAYKELEVTITDKNINLGRVPLINLEFGQGIGYSDISIDGDDDGGSDMVSGVLSSSSDPFSQAASYSFSPMYFKTRGYDNKFEIVSFNGVTVNDVETGRAIWNEWGGLNEVVRNKITVDDVAPTEFSFGNIGGSTKINALPSVIRKQTKLAISRSNRSYNNRVMFTYSTGLLPNNWAYTLSYSRRWSEEGRTEGTTYDAHSWFAGVEKKINENHSIALVTYGSPFKRGQSAGVTQEVYDLGGSMYYNPNWGFQNGEKRNARIKWSNQPMTMLTHNWTISDKAKLQSTMSYTFGKFGRTRLNWYKARDPRPDYYRYLPSWNKNNTDVFDYITAQWEEKNTDFTQINWDRLYEQNYLANSEGKQAVYILEDEVTNQKQFNLASVLNYFFSEKSKTTAGIEIIKYRSRNYKVIDDMLGSNYWVDIDQFAERDFIGDSIILQNDLNNPNKIIKEGDEFGYNYWLNNTSYNLWATHQWFLPKFDIYIGGDLLLNQVYREGLMKNGRNPNNSYGKSDTESIFTYLAKAGTTYKINGRNYITLNLFGGSVPTSLRDIYISPRTSNKLSAADLYSNVLSGDISYLLRFPNINGRVTLFQTYFNNHSEIMRFYHDDLRTFVNMAFYNQERVHQGVELALQYKINSMFTLQGSGVIGNYRYTNRPTATLNFENGSQPDTTWISYVKNFYVSGTPQIASNLTLKFNKNRWFVETGLNYFDKIYLSFNPERRTSNAITGLGPGDPLIDKITQQEKLKGGFTLDFSIGKSFRIQSHLLSINLNISNVLNNTSLISGGYEQLRYDFETKDINKFPPKYYYMYGTNFFFNVAFSL